MTTRASIGASLRVFSIPTLALILAAPAAAQSPSFTTIGGELGPGALYEIAMPTGQWNGELVVFVHGITPPSAPVALPAIGPIRETLTSLGFALVYSSFSENGYAVKDGMQRTHQLRGVFASKVGEPTRVYLFGRSMGGLIAVLLTERFPGQYDGVLSGCGLLGGGAAELKYMADGRVLFDYFFPGVLPGSAIHIPEGVDFSTGGPTYTAALAALMQGIVSSGHPTLQLAKTAGLAGSGPAEIVSTGMTVAGFCVTQTDAFFDLTNGHSAYDNTGVAYTGSTDDVALNAGVARYSSDPSAVEYIEHYGTPSGRLQSPVLTMHTTRDPTAPISHEWMFAKAVEEAGALPFLLQRTFNAYGHCAFSNADTAAAFLALVQWVHTGTKPQS